MSMAGSGFDDVWSLAVDLSVAEFRLACEDGVQVAELGCGWWPGWQRRKVWRTWCDVKAHNAFDPH